MPRSRASRSLSPTRASSGSVNRQNGTCRPVVTRSPPERLASTTRKSSSPMCVKYGLPAQSPTAQTPLAVVRSRSSTLTCPCSSVSTPAFSRPMPSVFGVRPPATSRCVPSIAPRPVCRRTDSPDLPLDAIDGGPGQDLDPLVPEEPLDRLGDVRVLAMDQRAVPLDDGHAAAEAAERLRQLEADVAAAQDDQVSREVVQLQGLDVGQRARLREAGGVVDPGARPGVDDRRSDRGASGSRPR